MAQRMKVHTCLQAWRLNLNFQDLLSSTTDLHMLPLQQQQNNNQKYNFK